MENIMIRTDVAVAFKNKALNDATKEIIVIGEKMQKNLYAIANVLAKVDNSKSYEEDGFKSTADYAMQVFGFKKSQAYTLIKVGKDWTSAKLESTLPHKEGKDFSVTQIEKLSTLGKKEEIIEVVKNGEVTPDMTVAEIREFVNKKKNRTKQSDELWEGTTDTMRTVIGYIDTIYASLKDIEFLLGNSKNGKKFTKFVDLVNEIKTEFNETLESEVK